MLSLGALLPVESVRPLHCAAVTVIVTVAVTLPPGPVTVTVTALVPVAVGTPGDGTLVGHGHTGGQGTGGHRRELVLDRRRDDEGGQTSHVDVVRAVGDHRGLGSALRDVNVTEVSGGAQTLGRALVAGGAGARGRGVRAVSSSGEGVHGNAHQDVHLDGDGGRHGALADSTRNGVLGAHGGSGGSTAELTVLGVQGDARGKVGRHGVALDGTVSTDAQGGDGLADEAVEGLNTVGEEGHGSGDAVAQIGSLVGSAHAASGLVSVELQIAGGVAGLSVLAGAEHLVRALRSHRHSDGEDHSKEVDAGFHRLVQFSVQMKKRMVETEI